MAIQTFRIFLLGLSLWGAFWVPCQSATVYDQLTIKHGTLTQDETWSGKIMLTGDVLIPIGRKVTLRQGTWLVFNDFDIYNFGSDEKTPELIVAGELNRGRGVRVMTVHDVAFQNFLSQYKSDAVAIVPEEVDLTPLRDEWQSYKFQYGALWAVMYSLILIL